jgi:polysaccharide export outer membrane protein
MRINLREKLPETSAGTPPKHKDKGIPMQKKLYRLIAATLVAGSTLSAASLAQAAEDTDAIAAEAAADTTKTTAKTTAQPAAVDLTPQTGKKAETKDGQPAYIERSDIFQTAELRREATSPTYRLYRGDTVAVNAVGFSSGDESDTKLAGSGISGFTVGIDGYVQLPYVGNVKMEGLTLDEAKEVLMESLTQYLRIPDLSLLITSYGPRKVYVMGEVAHPGIVNLGIDNMNAYAALASAGGWTSHGRSTRTQIIRVIDGTMYYRRLDMKKYIMKHDLTQNVMVEDGDILYVPPTNGFKFNEEILPYVSAYAVYHSITN